MLPATSRTLVFALVVSNWACTLKNPSYVASAGGSGSDSGSSSSSNSGSDSDSSSSSNSGSSSSSSSGNETSGGTSSGGSNSDGTDSGNSGSDASSSGSTGDTNTSEETGETGQTDPTSGNDNSCGDGELTGNEECDDGNTESDDGCSKYCHKEPIGIIFSEEVSWTDLGGNANGLNMASASCGAIVQVGGKVDMGSKFPCDIELSCISEIDIQKGEIIFPFPTMVGSYGQCFPGAGDPWMRPCGEGQVVVGFTGRYFSVIDILKFRCRKIKLNKDTMKDPFTISFDGPPVPLMPVGSMAPGPPLFENKDCPDGKVATGAKFYSDGYDLQGVKLQCSHMKLEYYK